MKLLWIDPYNLSKGTDLQIANGFEIELVPGPLTAATLERVLRDEYDALHWFGHGAKGLLMLSETEELDAADLCGMLEKQRGLRFVFLNACNGSQVATVIHNALHVPVIAHDDEILTTAARHFASVFYRRYKQAQNVGEAFDTAKESLLRHPAKFEGQAQVPLLINGDMSTKQDLSECMQYVKTEIAQMNVKLDRLEVTVNRIRGGQNRTLFVLLGLLLLAQLATPWLSSLFR